MTTGELLAVQLDGTRDWTKKLMADLSGDDWSFQPAPGLPHATWLCGHMTVSQHLLIHVRCLGGDGPLDETFVSCFPTGKPVVPVGRPVKSVAEQDYPPLELLLETMDDTHAKTLAVVREMSDELLAEPAFGADGKLSHPHYRDKLGAVTHCARHEAFHAGQLATLRRLLGKSFLR